MEHIKRFFSRYRHLIYPFLTLIGALFFAPVLNLDIQGDEGFFGTQTLRITQGQLPNLDFACPYIGGLLFYHLFWFKLLGPSLLTLRIDLLFLFIIFIPSVYYLSRLMMEKRWAILCTTLVMFTTLPMYPFSGANWYATFFSFFALAVSVKTLSNEERPKSLPIFIAGIFIGCSLLIKQTVGLYTGFSFLLFFLISLKNEPEGQNSCRKEQRASLLGKIYTITGISGIIFYLFWIFKDHFGIHTFFVYLLPLLIVIFISCRRIYRQSMDFHPLTKRVHTLALGFLIPLILYFSPYLVRGRLPEFLREAFLDSPTTLLRLFYQDFLSIIDPLVILISFLVLMGLYALSKTRWLGYLLLSLATIIFASSIKSFNNWTFTSLHLYVQLPLWIIFGSTVYFCIQNNSKIKQSGQQAILFSYVYIFALFLFLSTYPVFAVPYVATNIAPLLIVLIYCLSKFSTLLPKCHRWALCIVPAYFILFGMVNLYRYEGQPLESLIDTPFPKFSRTLSSYAGQIKVGETYYFKIEPLLNFIEKYSTRNNDMYLLANNFAEIYLLSSHINPVPYDYHFHSLRSRGIDIIYALEENNVQYVIVDIENKPIIPYQNTLTHYLENHFRVAKQLPSFLILSRYKTTKNPDQQH